MSSPGAPSPFEEGTPVYLDYNGSTPVDPRVKSAIVPFLGAHFGNPSSSHYYGTVPRAAVATARHQVAALINAQHDDEVVFTSGGTESINYALKGAMRLGGGPRPGGHIVTSVVEHVAVLQTCKYLEATSDVTVTYVGVEPLTGRVTPESVVAAVRPDTRLVTIMHANNELGTLNPIGDIVAAVKAAFPAQSILFHSDTSQSVTKVPVDVQAFGVDFASVVGHKTYATKGIGAVYIRRGAPSLDNLVHGASQELGKRGGTENVALAVGLGAACQLAADSMDTGIAHSLHTRERLFSALVDGLPAGLRPTTNGHPEHRLPNTLSVWFPSTSAADLLASVADSVAASAGAACHSGVVKVSYVLRAIGLTDDQALGTCRFTVGRFTTDADVDRAAAAIVAGVKRLATRSSGAAAGAGGDSSASTAAVAGSTAATPPSVPPVAAPPSSASAWPLPRRPADALPWCTDPVYMTDTELYSCTASVTFVLETRGGELFVPGDSRDPPVALGPAHATFVDAIVVDRSVIHPQGGGQPSDLAVVGTADGAWFDVFLAKPSRDGSGAVVLMGLFRASAPARLPTPDDAPAVGTSPSSTTHGGEARRFAAGAAVNIAVSAPRRVQSARLHSAGHLLDACMKAIGQSLPAGKGYHFDDGPFVEYKGMIPADDRAAVMSALQDECDRLVAADVPTSVIVDLPASDAVAGAGISPADLSHLPPDRDVRIVSIGPDNPCPCGGTHVKSSGVIGRVVIDRLRCKKKVTKVSYHVEQ